MSTGFDYSQRMLEALRSVLVGLLRDVAEHGLPGNHHFLITFDTTHPGVDIADWMRAQYETEMTIVVQHWFDNLSVMDDRFAITLNFNNTPEPMVIPFDAVKTFVDPSVEFGLRFDAAPATEDVPVAQMMVDEEPEAASDEKESSEVISLDAFRKD
jgi:hypothetical protein